ncbi:hypothetical protein BJX70DRAFT_385725 [Aspergillus crustosus]
MLARHRSILTPPSALLVIDNFDTIIHVFHFLSENTIKRFSLTTPSSTIFCHGGATEQAREQIGVVTVHAGDGETANSFLDDVETRIRKLRNDSLKSVKFTQLVQDISQAAALDAIHEREGRDRSMHATRMYPVYIIYIACSRPVRILTEPTSFPS